MMEKSYSAVIDGEWHTVPKDPNRCAAFVPRGPSAKYATIFTQCTRPPQDQFGLCILHAKSEGRRQMLKWNEDDLGDLANVLEAIVRATDPAKAISSNRARALAHQVASSALLRLKPAKDHQL